MNEILIDFRKELHQFPELSGKEFDTASRIVSFAKKYNPPAVILENVGGAGVVLIYHFENSGPTIGIRCELDALPIKENNELSYTSTKNGVSHKCGHDGHMSIVAGLMLWLKENHLKRGKLILIFQPAEETGQGAQAMLKDYRFSKLSIDYVFALHNIPGASLHTIIKLPNGFSPAVCSLRIGLLGKVTHASTPEAGINPSIGISKIVSEFNELNNPEEGSSSFALLTPVCIDMGQKAYGISAGAGELHYTIRAWTDDVLENLQADMLDIIKAVSTKEGLTFNIEWLEKFPAAINDEACNAIIANAGKSLGLEILVKETPFRFGEDFGWFSKHYSCGIFGIGAGVDTPALHNDQYDFPDELIATGVHIFGEIVKSKLL